MYIRRENTKSILFFVDFTIVQLSGFEKKTRQFFLKGIISNVMRQSASVMKCSTVIEVKLEGPKTVTREADDICS